MIALDNRDKIIQDQKLKTIMPKHFKIKRYCIGNLKSKSHAERTYLRYEAKAIFHNRRNQLFHAFLVWVTKFTKWYLYKYKH